MSTLDQIFEELKALPPERLELAADYVHRLRAIGRTERDSALRRTSGVLSNDEADAWELAINEDCERIDENTW